MADMSGVATMRRVFATAFRHVAASQRHGAAPRSQTAGIASARSRPKNCFARNRMRMAIACCVLAGCTYKPGSFGYYGSGQRVTVGCLEIAIDRRPDMEGAPVLHYHFGNRCKTPVEV